jgi:hypothetical protein
MMTDNQHLDEAYEQLSATGPEFDGWLSNHGPMAARRVDSRSIPARPVTVTAPASPGNTERFVDS